MKRTYKGVDKFKSTEISAYEYFFRTGGTATSLLYRQLLLWMKSAESEADHCNNKNGTQQMRGIKKEKEKRMMFQAPGKLMLWVNNGNEFFKGKKTFMDNWVITSARFSLCLLPEVKNERKRGLQEGTTNHQSHNSRDTDGSKSGRHLRYLASTSSMSK